MHLAAVDVEDVRKRENIGVRTEAGNLTQEVEITEIGFRVKFKPERA